MLLSNPFLQSSSLSNFSLPSVKPPLAALPPSHVTIRAEKPDRSKLLSFIKEKARQQLSISSGEPPSEPAEPLPSSKVQIACYIDEKFKKLTLPFLEQPSEDLPASQPTTRRMKPVHGKVVCHTNDKTVNVQVTRYTIHPKYKRRIRVMKKFQAHDPENRFKVGDMVTLQKCRPMSKTKHHIAVPYVDPHGPRGEASGDSVLNLPLQSEQ